MTYVPIRYYVAPTRSVRSSAERGFRRKPWAVIDRKRGIFTEFDTRLAAQRRVFELRQRQLAEAAHSHSTPEASE